MTKTIKTTKLYRLVLTAAAMLSVSVPAISFLSCASTSAAASSDGSAASKNAAAASRTAGEAANMENSNMYDLIIHGYDWGPGADKIILTLDKTVSAKKVKAEDFQVKTFILGYNWTAFPPKLDNMGGYRTVTAAYLCDENGGRADGNKKSSRIALELSVGPEDAFSNPFIYGSDMMNHWQKTYDVEITNEKLDIDISKLNKRICPEADQFTVKEAVNDGITLHYAYWKPAAVTASTVDAAASQKLPLIIWLHGMGEGGNDPYIALLGNKVVNLISADIQNCFKNGACVLVPQVNGFWMQAEKGKDKMKGWVTDPASPAVSIYTKSLFALIDSFVQENPEIDRKHIYIGGCSNGGYMTMNMILEYPDYFAAAYPVCQAYPDSKIDDDKLQILARQHIWFTQAKNDTTVTPAQFTAATFDRLQQLQKASGTEAPMDIHFTFWPKVTDQTGLYKKNNKPYDYNGHFSWIYTLNNQCAENDLTIFQWLAGL